MAMDSYSQALAARRGRGIDPALTTTGHGGLDANVGMGGAGHANLPTISAPPPHTPPVHEGDAPLMPGHIAPQGEMSRGAPLPVNQSAGVGGGELSGDVRDAVSGHMSKDEYEALKQMPANTLSSKAKMSAAKSKYEPAGK